MLQCSNQLSPVRVAWIAPMCSDDVTDLWQIGLEKRIKNLCCDQIAPLVGGGPPRASLFGSHAAWVYLTCLWTFAWHQSKVSFGRHAMSHHGQCQFRPCQHVFFLASNLWRQMRHPFRSQKNACLPHGVKYLRCSVCTSQIHHLHRLASINQVCPFC